MPTNLRCRLHLHHYVERTNKEVMPPERYMECTRCGRTKDAPMNTLPADIPPGLGGGAGPAG